jgi:hypothetical protein
MTVKRGLTFKKWCLGHKCKANEYACPWCRAAWRAALRQRRVVAPVQLAPNSAILAFALLRRLLDQVPICDALAEADLVNEVQAFLAAQQAD